MLLAVLLLASAGCSRQFYRLQADQEVTNLVTEKSFDPRWALPDFHLHQDPRSRYFDPFDPDREPMPPDDPAAHQYMHCVDGMKGWPYWHENGSTPALENPDWRTYLPEYVELTPQGEVKLSVDSALRIAYIHSPSYQTQLEEIYLTALDVSTERFRFDTQFFGSVTTDYASTGKDRLAVGDQSILTVGADAQLRRRFSTAGELLVGFANSFVWQFAGPGSHVEMSLLNLNLIQPLLRGAGQEVALEQLTIVERALLYNLRAFQRYRQGFYTQVVIGELGVSGPQRRGGFFGGTGLTGFTGQGSGGLGGVGEASGFTRGAGGGNGAGGGVTGFAGGGAGQVGGFLGLLQQLQQIRNTRDSLRLQLRTLSLLESHLAAGVIDLTQVDQFRQNIETERATLLQAETGLANGLDQYKTGTLGLPPNVPIALDDATIRQFQLITPEMTELQGRLYDAQQLLGDLPLEPSVEQLQQTIDKFAALATQLNVRIASVEADLQELTDRLPTRNEDLDTAERKRLAENVALLQRDLEQTGQRRVELNEQLASLSDTLTPDRREKTFEGLVSWLSEMLRLVQELSLVQARARLESVTVNTVSLEPEQALCVALTNRLDLMNNRAALVDTWRLIAFNANALESDLTVTFNGDISTSGNNIAKFQAPTGRLQASVQFDPPFTRLLERNNYRSVLIDYQRDRRRYIQTVDGVHQTLRQLLRQLELHRVNLEIQRRAVAISIRRVDLTREELNRPVPPPEPGQPINQFGPTAALNLLTALSDLRSTQNNFMSVWLAYYATQLQLARELGTMQLDPSGKWIETEPLVPECSRWCLEQGGPLESIATPPSVPNEWLREVEEEPLQLIPPGSEQLPPPVDAPVELPAQPTNPTAPPAVIPTALPVTHLRARVAEVTGRASVLPAPRPRPTAAPAAAGNPPSRLRLRRHEVH